MTGSPPVDNDSMYELVTRGVAPAGQIGAVGWGVAEGCCARAGCTMRLRQQSAVHASEDERITGFLRLEF